MNDASPASDIPRARTGPVKPGPWRIADIVDGRKLRIQLTAAALDNGSDPIAQRKRALDLIHAALGRERSLMAAYQMLAWEAPLVEFVGSCKVRPTIDLPITEILMNLAYIRDMKETPAPLPPPRTRTECTSPVTMTYTKPQHAQTCTITQTNLTFKRNNIYRQT